MDLAGVLGFESITTEVSEGIKKSYYGISDYHRERIKQIARLMSETGIGPKIYKMYQGPGRLIIYMEKLKPLDPESGFEDFNIPLMKREIKEKVQHLHDLGWAHGDLHIGNIGERDDGEPVIFDYDTMYPILEGKEKDWVQDIMKQGFGWDGTYEDFVEYDFINWGYDLPSENERPTTIYLDT